MILHEAVRAARLSLGLSQKKLAEQAGIQRRQLATLEEGGNITLNTLRKVLLQLPNLQTFEFASAVGGVAPGGLDPAAIQAVVDTLDILTGILDTTVQIIAAGELPGDRERAALRQAKTLLDRKLPPSPIPRPAPGEPMTPELLLAQLSAMEKLVGGMKQQLADNPTVMALGIQDAIDDQKELDEGNPIVEDETEEDLLDVPEEEDEA